jgi:hypothetical protein
LVIVELLQLVDAALRENMTRKITLEHLEASEGGYFHYFLADPQLCAKREF